jgi:hypothetical protein
MKLTENTKVRIRVPKHLYEAIQAQLDKKHGMDEAISGKAEELKDFYEKVKEQVDGGTDLDSAISFVMNDLGMEMMEESEDINEYVGLNPADYDMTTLMGLGLPILTALLSVAQQKLGPKITNAIKSAIAKKKGGQEKPTEEMDETLDLKTLMEAVSAITKKEKMAKEKKQKLTKEKEDAVKEKEKIAKEKIKTDKIAAEKKKVAAAKKK